MGALTSKDFRFKQRAWKRLRDQPLLPAGAPGAWNSSESGHPGVFTDSDGRSYLFFQGNDDHGKTWWISRKRIVWKRATTQGALAATFGGLLSWLLVEVLIVETPPEYAYALIGAERVPPQLVGLGVSMLGMLAGSLLPQWVGHKTPGRPLHELQHHVAAETHHVHEHHIEHGRHPG